MNLDDISNSQLSALIDEWIKGERDRAIMKDRFINCICFEPLAEKYALSVVTVKRIIYKNTNILSKHIDTKMI